MRNHLKKITCVAAFAVGLSAALSAADDLTICTEGAYPPFSAINEKGELFGFDVDIANALCDEMGASCELIAVDWDGIIPALIENKCDAIIASMSITEDRKKRVDFSEKYYNTPARFAAAEGVDWEDSNEGLMEKVVGVQRATIHQDFMEGEFPDVELRLYASQDEAYLDLQAGRIDAIMADSIAMDEGFLSTESGEGFAFFGMGYSVPEYHGEGAGVAIRKGEDELRTSFNAAIQALRDSGKYEEINDKYFDFDIY